jgi:uncharacterized membrane protein
METKSDPAREQRSRLAGIMHRNIHAVLEERRKHDARMSRQERIAAGITRFTGSMTFVYLHAGLFGGWIVTNMGWIPGVKPFDPFPFVMLAMCGIGGGHLPVHFRAHQPEPDVGSGGPTCGP